MLTKVTINNRLPLRPFPQRLSAERSIVMRHIITCFSTTLPPTTTRVLLTVISTTPTSTHLTATTHRAACAAATPPAASASTSRANANCLSRRQGQKRVPPTRYALLAPTTSTASIPRGLERPLCLVRGLVLAPAQLLLVVRQDKTYIGRDSVKSTQR